MHFIFYVFFYSWFYTSHGLVLYIDSVEVTVSHVVNEEENIKSTNMWFTK